MHSINQKDQHKEVNKLDSEDKILKRDNHRHRRARRGKKWRNQVNQHKIYKEKQNYRS